VALATIVVVAVLALDYFVVEPLRAQRDELDVQIANKQRDQERGLKLVSDSRRMSRRWTEISSALKRDESQLESQALQYVLEWARGAGMPDPSSFKRERVEREKEFVKVTFRATGTGTMAQIGNFLYRIQTASVPVRITDLTISSKKEGTDDLSVQVGIATIYLAGEQEKKDKTASVTSAREVWQ
jgi:hypothetical protein